MTANKIMSLIIFDGWQPPQSIDSEYAFFKIGDRQKFEWVYSKTKKNVHKKIKILTNSNFFHSILALIRIKKIKFIL